MVNAMVSLLSWYSTAGSILYPCSLRNSLVQIPIDSISEIATSSDSVEDLVTKPYFFDATLSGPEPRVIMDPLCLFMSG